MKDFQEENQILFEAIEAYRNGDRDKATIIYESTKKYTFNILHKEVERYKNQGALTSDVVSITEDIMQELYIEFFNKITNFRNEDPKSIFKWISVVAHRRLSTYVKENGTEVLQFEKNEDYREENEIWDSSEINDSDMESNHELLPEAALEDKEFRELILDFVQSLPEAQAQTILLHFRGGLKYQEIADEMGVSLITVKTRMKKAKDSLEEIITKYEKKTGTKLHSVSILPLLWLLYRMASEETVVPMAVDTVVTSSIAEVSSVAGASGVGIGGATTVGSVATAGVTKAIGTKILIGIISTTVVIGGAVVGSQLIDKKSETTIEQGDSEDKELDNKQDNEGSDDTSSKEDNETSNTNDEGNSETNQNETAGDNNGSDTNNTGSDDNVTQNNTGNGTNTNGTSGNTGAEENANGAGSNTNGTDSNTGSGNEDSGNSSGNEGTGGSGDNSGNEETSGNENNTGSGNDSGNEDQGESTAAKGTKENPYRIGEKIVGKQVYGNGTELVDIEFTITKAYSLEEGLALTGDSYSSSSDIPIVDVTYKVTGTEGGEHNGVHMSMFAVGDEKTKDVSFLWENVDGYIKNNTMYSLRFHTKYATDTTEYKYLRVAFADADAYFRNYFYVALY